METVSSKLQGWSIEGLTVFDSGCCDIANLRYRKCSGDVHKVILMHKKGCLEDQRIRQGPADLLTKSFMDEEEINGIWDSCFEMRIY